MKTHRLLGLAGAVLLMLARLAAQGVGVDAVQVGPVATHDHFRYDLHIGIKDDPYPHEVREEYAYDGVDVGVGIRWHWGRAKLATDVQVTPVARSHYAFDQDTDFGPDTAATHGDAGTARSRSVSVRQWMPLHDFGRRGHLRYEVGLERQWSGYGWVTTYDLNSNPALPSTSYQRQLNERAILYELEYGVQWGLERGSGAWRWGLDLTPEPLEAVFMRNHIPVLAPTSALGYGGSVGLRVARRLGGWDFELAGTAGEQRGYRWVEGFERQRFTLSLEVQPAHWF